MPVITLYSTVLSGVLIYLALHSFLVQLSERGQHSIELGFGHRLGVDKFLDRRLHRDHEATLVCFELETDLTAMSTEWQKGN